MNDLEKALHRLPKPDPSPQFTEIAKHRLLSRISLEYNENWFVKWLKRVAPVNPSIQFMQQSRVRLMSQIHLMKQPVIHWFLYTKRMVASTLVMMIAVTTTLFFVDGNQQVIASENTFLEVLTGEVTVKHADRLVWEPVIQQTELSEGDLIRTGDTGSAIIRFFDDTRLRLAADSSLLISRLDVSPGYARQGVIKTFLHQGKAWVQTLNVDDGYAGFTLITRDAIVSALNASFDAEVILFESTTIRSLRHGVEVSALRQNTRDVFAEGRLSSLQQVTLSAVSPYQRMTDLAGLAPLTDISEEDREVIWVIDNLHSDQLHLSELRDRELVSLRSATGVLPGQVLYPVKRAKERLSLALRFNEESQLNTQINMANKRLNEAIVLLGQGEVEHAEAVLADYQSLVQIIAEARRETEVVNSDELANLVVAAHQKTLIAALPSDVQIGLVKQVLNETEEYLANDPLEKAEIRLDNALEAFSQLQDFVANNNFEAVEEALENNQFLTSDLLDEVSQFEDDELKKILYADLLGVQYEQRRILSELAKVLENQESSETLRALVETADLALDGQIKHTAAVAHPLLPDVILSQQVMLPLDQKVHEFAEKVNIYKTFQGQKNQISRLLGQNPQFARDMEFLTKLRAKLSPRAQDILNVKIFQLERELIEAKSRRVKLKIDRAMKAREKRS